MDWDIQRTHRQTRNEAKKTYAPRDGGGACSWLVVCAVLVLVLVRGVLGCDDEVMIQ